MSQTKIIKYQSRMICDHYTFNVMAVGKNIPCKKGKEKKYHIPYNIKAVAGRMLSVEEDVNFGEEN